MCGSCKDGAPETYSIRTRTLTGGRGVYRGTEWGSEGSLETRLQEESPEGVVDYDGGGTVGHRGMDQTRE